MLHPSTLTFLSDLKENNNKPWLDANRATYEAAKGDFIQLVTALIDGLSTIDPAIAESGLQAKNCLFRINRDIRFSPNKSPYKTNFGAWLNPGGKKSESAGYYLNVQPGGSFVAGGLYMPDPAALSAVRQEIDYSLDEFEGLLNQPAFARHFKGLDRSDALQRPPKGYTADNPAVEYLKLKSFTVSHPLSDTDLTKPTLTKRVLDAFAALQPLVHYLNRAVS
ncbi:DUF2461 domain-containing protein [Spirosoma sp. 209]|uniref:DUF2461 domain-containing protein n=1 Tax=Spirosoma sp. 209 TaxID=1955701 RepID=UPI00098D0A42|nr:DUF2461 domain-containing protein [Spirosoma sp. 209]